MRFFEKTPIPGHFSKFSQQNILMYIGMCSHDVGQACRGSGGAAALTLTQDSPDRACSMLACPYVSPFFGGKLLCRWSRNTVDKPKELITNTRRQTRTHRHTQTCTHTQTHTHISMSAVSMDEKKCYCSQSVS